MSNLELKSHAVAGLTASVIECPSSLDNMDLKLLKTIGTGASGIVVLVQYKNNKHRQRAMKIYDKQRERNKGYSLRKSFLTEVAILQAVDHKHIMTSIVAYNSPLFRMITMPYFPGGTLEQRLLTLTLDLTYVYFRQLFGAVLYLHRRGIIHGDIKPSNILIREGDEAVLTDFGHAENLLTEQPILIGGTHGYMAPELEARRGPNVPFHIDFKKCDAYSLGVTLYKMASNLRSGEQVGRCPQWYTRQMQMPHLLRLILTHMCHQDAEYRWSVEEMFAKRHTYPELKRYI